MKTIDITPTWKAVMPLMIEVLKNPNASFDSKRDIELELYRLANMADKQLKKEQS